MLQRVELDFGSTKQAARESCINHVPKVHMAALCAIEQRCVIGEVTLKVPGPRYCPGGLGGGAEIKIDPADPDRGCAVKLASGLNRKVRIEDDFAPWSGTSGRRSKGEWVGREIGKNKIIKELDHARGGLGPRHRRIRGCSIR